MAEIYNEKVYDLFTEINSKQNERTALKIENCKGMLYFIMHRVFEIDLCNQFYPNDFF